MELGVVAGDSVWKGVRDELRNEIAEVEDRRQVRRRSEVSSELLSGCEGV